MTEPPDLEQLAEDWITLWQSELGALAADPGLAEAWAASVALGAAWWRAQAAGFGAAAPRGSAAPDGASGWPWAAPGAAWPPMGAFDAAATPPGMPHPMAPLPGAPKVRTPPAKLPPAVVPRAVASPAVESPALASPALASQAVASPAVAPPAGLPLPVVPPFVASPAVAPSPVASAADAPSNARARPSQDCVALAPIDSQADAATSLPTGPPAAGPAPDGQRNAGGDGVGDGPDTAVGQVAGNPTAATMAARLAGLERRLAALEGRAGGVAADPPGPRRRKRRP